MMTQSTRHERKKERKKLGKMPKPWRYNSFFFAASRFLERYPVYYSSDMIHIYYTCYIYVYTCTSTYTVRQQRYTYFALLWLLFGSLVSLPTSSRSDTYRTSQNSSSSMGCYLRQIHSQSVVLSSSYPHTHTAE